jgi:oligoribonuclease NrnB/cAMP/cGMP phosphodiesterase (DHH superfamily)
MTFENSALVTHKNCSDGSTCAILFMAAGGKKENIHYGIPDDTVDDLVRDLYFNWEGPIFIVDVSISEELAEIVNSRSNVYLLDHHKTALPLAKYKFCEIEEHNHRCGSMMFYDWIRDNTEEDLMSYEDLVCLIDDHDRWIQNFEDSNDLAMLHDLLGQRKFIERFTKEPDCELTSEERYVIDITKAKEVHFISECKQNFVPKSISFDGKNYNMAIIHASHPLLNKAAHSLLEDPELNIDVVMSVSARAVSFRSRATGPDVSRLAKLNGGGGHVCAGGTAVGRILGRPLEDILIENLKFS